jgi:formyltetrahydrofolate deformylase
MTTSRREYILTIACPDVAGIVAAVATFISAQHGFILESTQYGDPDTATFFQRIHFAASDQTPEDAALKKLFAEQIGTPFQMRWHLHDGLRKPRIMIMVSKANHCLNTLLHRYQNGTLKVEIPLVVSNHPDLQRLVAWHDIPYYHLPIDKRGKEAQEERVLELAESHDIDVVVLARYMQVLSPSLCHTFEGRAINIHHSFLPSFKGAKPYHQAHTRGVKLIGATAHYVTEDLDEGPIIEQEVARVDHTYRADDLVSSGQEIESMVLYRAVRYHAEHRVLLNGHKTVVFK